MTETLIKVEGVSKKFCRSLKRSLWYGLRDLGSELSGRSHGGDGELRIGEFWAVKDVNFYLKRGECLGLIGRNGAGKTSLLRMLNGLIRPDIGRIEMRGSVGAMIALGAGVKDVLSGRENAYAMAALRGMSKRDADRKIVEIIEFSELEDAIDAPMRSYSSGMKVRLNFAVAAALEPDILLLDEILAVGDASFRNKCYNRIAELRRRAAVIFVSHNMEQIARTSSQALVMDHGKVVYAGSVDEGISCYESLNAKVGESQLTSGSFLSVKPPIRDFEMKLETIEIVSGGAFRARLSFNSDQSLKVFTFRVIFYNARGAFAADGCITGIEAAKEIQQGVNHIEVQVENVPLKNGVYAVAFNFLDEIGDPLVWAYKTHTIRVKGAYSGGIADCQLKLAFKP